MNIGVFTPFLDGHLYGGILHHLNVKAYEYQCRITAIKTPYKVRQYPVPLAAAHMDAWFILQTEPHENVWRELARLGKPIIGINHQSDNYSYIDFDSSFGIGLAIDHLVEHGHRRIAFIGHMNNQNTAQKFEGYLAGLERHGIAYADDLVLRITDDARKGGHSAAAEIVAKRWNPTAVIASDLCAIALQERLQQEGCKDSPAIISWNGMPQAEHADPSLTVITTPIEEMAEQAFSMLLDTLRNAQSVHRGVWVKPKLVVRESCGCKEEVEQLSKSRRQLFRALNRMSDAASVNQNIMIHLASGQIDKIKDLSWIESRHYSWGCLGYWEELEGQPDKKQIRITAQLNTRQTGDEILGTLYAGEQFPPLHAIPEEAFRSPYDMVTLLPLFDNGKEWGVLVLVQRIDENVLYYKSHTITSFVNRLSMAFDRAKLFDQLHQANEILETVLNATTDAIFDWCIKDRVIQWSKHATRIVGDTLVMDELEFWSRIYASDQPWIRSVLKEQGCLNKGFQVEFRLQNAAGSYIWVELNGQAICDAEGRPVRMIGSIRDISERKRSEELVLRSEKQAVVGQLAAGVAHEIRNPLTALKGFTQLIQRKYNVMDEYIGVMLEELNRIEHIVNEFLFVSKPHLIDYRVNRIRTILDSVLLIMGTQAILSNVQIINDVDEQLDILCDENQVKQVMINLIKNAIESMPEGGTMTIDSSILLEERQVHIRFRDEGTGISPERLGKLGEPFYTTKEKGTGMGLLMCYRIMEMHKGQLRIESELGRGTLVTMVLPYE
jgi:PAS domain S-box-containing protein